ncbi:MAG: site-specific integrase [Labilithrix sp.]|nr:site-specific integrase [Labilithrix sp.]
MTTKHDGVYRLKEGGFLIRALLVHPLTGKRKEVKKVLLDCVSADNAAAHLLDEKKKVRVGLVVAAPSKTRFADFAISVNEEKIANRKIKSAKSRDNKKTLLAHLIDGVTGESGARVDGLGDYYIETLPTERIEQWRREVQALIMADDYSPTTCNTWLRELRTICREAKRRFKLAAPATEGISMFDTSEVETFTPEDPNSLGENAEKVSEFLATMKELYPQHFAMTFLGFIMGLRPSMLRPVRRKGSESDVDFDKGMIWFRRSHTRGNEVMRMTKNGLRYGVGLPPEAMAVIRWHIDTQLTTDEQKESDLLFATEEGGFRAPCVLNKPFAVVSKAIGLPFVLTQKAMRRTFTDLTARAKVENAVRNSIGGWKSDAVPDGIYRTVFATDQRAAVAKVIDIMGARESRGQECAPACAPTSKECAPKEKAG